MRTGSVGSPRPTARPAGSRVLAAGPAASVALLGVVASILSVTTAGLAREIFVGAATLLVPGFAAMPAAAVRWGRLLRCSWAIAVSIVSFAVLALAMVWTGLWYPRPVVFLVLLGSSWVIAVRAFRTPSTPAHPSRAGAGRRAAAAVIDTAPVLLILAAAAVLGGLSAEELHAGPVLAGAGVLGAGWLALHLVAGARGASLGMRVAGLRVVDRTTGLPLGLSRYTARTATSAAAVGTSCGLLQRPGSASWADLRSDSVVIPKSAAPPVPVAAGPGRARISAATWFAAISLVVAALGYVAFTATADVTALGPWGLTTALGVGWLAVLALVVIVLAVAPISSVPEGWIAAHLGLLVLMVYGTPAFVELTPRVPWALKHVAVTRFILENGSVDPSSADIYQRWPGMFAWSALLARTTGVTQPVRWEALAESGFAVLNVILVVAIARTLAPGSRWVWAAGTIFAVTNGVGQNYFAPQALAYSLWLFVILLVLRELSAAPTGIFRRLVERLRGRPGGPAPTWPIATDSARADRVVLGAVLATFAVIVASHQLTPYVALLALIPLTIVGVIRPRWLVVVLTVLTASYLIPNFTFINDKWGLLGSLDPLRNVTYSAVDVAQLSTAETWQRRGTLAVAGVAILLGLLGLVTRLRAREPRQVLVVGFLMLSPGLLALVQSYGGEIRLRAYLFALPWIAIAATWFFSDIGRARRWRATILYPALVVVISGLFVVTYFQPQATNRTSVATVQSLEWLDQHLETGDVVLTTGGTPAVIGPNYVRAVVSPLASIKSWRTTDLTVKDVKTLAKSASPGAHRAILVVTDGFLVAPDPAPFAPGELSGLVDSILRSPDGELLFQSGDTRVIALQLG